MIQNSYFLNPETYTWGSALCWGNFIGHCKKVRGSLGKYKAVHLLFAVVEFLPIISQISSIIEKILVQKREGAQHAEVGGKTFAPKAMDSR
ncbi:hypothetical protein PHSC3_000973 [Chlamydiales bacterium STE3]|nr:hypothetical protein PHSC3_000973 [Chlamydiales bacterium STE3]